MPGRKKIEYNKIKQIRARGEVMTEETERPENHTLRLLQEIRAEMRDGFEKSAAEVARVHADVAEVRADQARADVKMTRIAADVLATKSLVLDVVVKLTALERRVSVLENAPSA